MNTSNLIGRFVKDPELRYTQNGVAIASGTIAVKRPFKNNGEYESDFINTVAFKKTAELVAQHFKKGDMIGVTGRIQTRKYENNEGRTIYVTEVVIENITFLPKSSQSNESTTSNQEKPDPFAQDGTPIDISDDMLPF